MKKLQRILKWLLYLIASLAVVVIACWLLLPDEDLNPGAQKLIAVPPAPPAAQNAYFMIWGLRASPEIDAHAAGQQIVAEHERVLADNDNISDFKADKFLGASPLSFDSSSKRYCDIEKQRCLTVYQAMQAQIEADSAKYARYVERYRALRGYAQFSETVMTMTLASPLPTYQDLTRLSELVDATVALRVASPTTREAALDELGAEIASWRRILANSDALITQMVCVAILQRKYRLTSEIMSAYPEVVRQYPARIAQITAPLLVEETNLVRTLGGEFRFTAHLYRDLTRLTEQAAEADFLGKLYGSLSLAGGYRPNATINRAYSIYQESAQLYAKTPKEVLAGHAELSLNQNEFNLWAPSVILYNPVGKILASIALPSYSGYAFRLYDLVGLSRLIDIQRRIIEGNVDPEKRAEFLAATGPDLTDPYTGTPIKWDATQKTLSFAGHGKRLLKEGRMQVDL